jgi:hypothetical protein
MCCALKSPARKTFSVLLTVLDLLPQESTVFPGGLYVQIDVINSC